MMLHPRHVPVETARRELLAFMLDWRERHDLTVAEELLLFSEEVLSKIRNAVLAEREKPKRRRGKQ